MKYPAPILAVLLVAGCNQANDPAAPNAEATAAAPAQPAATPAPAAATEPATPASTTPASEQLKRGSTSGVVQSIDATARTVTIAHGPVEALGWPGMTMTFQAPGADLSTIKAGDNVNFEFDSSGSDGTIVSITKQ